MLGIVTSCLDYVTKATFIQLFIHFILFWYLKEDFESSNKLFNVMLQNICIIIIVPLHNVKLKVLRIAYFPLMLLFWDISVKK